MNADFHTQGLDELITAWRQEGYPATGDIMVMTYWPQK